MNIGICGAGTMGRGIALAAIQSGHVVILLDVFPEALEGASTYVHAQLTSSMEKGRITAATRDAAQACFSTSTDIGSFNGADLVIEAIAERLDVKHELLRKLEGVCRPDCIFASNTSSIAITALARCLEDPSRLVGLHFFNPAHIMKLVEVIRGTLSSEHVVETAITFARSLGKTAVVARDVPGFIVNRVARNYYNEAQRIVMEQAATAEQVDRSMKAIGFKMGPFELMDLIGVDVNLDVTKSMWSQYFNEPRFTPSLLQQQTVDGGLYGRKTGRGFYGYDR